MSKLTKEAFIKALKEMNLLEIKELIDGLKEEFGIDPSVALVSDKNIKESNEEKEEKEEKTNFQVILKNFNIKEKIKIIKEIHNITRLDLRKSKELTETPNAVIKENVNKIEADDIKNKLEQLGAEIELK